MRGSQFGQFQIYTGNGKGKTTAALGLALRALGRGANVYLGQFMKRGATGETKALARFGRQIRIEQFGSGRFFFAKKSSIGEEKRRASQGLAKIRKALGSECWDLVICDEINVAVSLHLLDSKEVLEMIASRPTTVELVFTGRTAPRSFINRADLVSEVREIKHYYSKDMKARKGIEQ